MNITITEKFIVSNISITKTENAKIPNLRASAIITFKGEDDSYFSISGFTVWKSKQNDSLNVSVPQKRNFGNCFEYFLPEKSFWKKLKAEIIKQYEDSTIPIIEERESGVYETK